MEQYRRKPLNLIDQAVPLSNTVAKLTNQRPVAPMMPAMPVLPEVPVVPEVPAEMPDMSMVPDEVVEQVTAAPVSEMPSPESLVEQAASILDGGTQSSPEVVPIHDPLMTSPLGFNTLSSPGYSFESLVTEMHSFVDTLAQLLAHRPQTLGGWEAGGSKTSMTENMAAAPMTAVGENVPLLRSPHPLHPGETAHLSFKVHNDTHQAAQVQFSCTDLRNHSGDYISSSVVEITPSAVTLEPDGMATIAIAIPLPETLAPGQYSGLLLATELSYLRAVISIDVAEA